MFKDMSFGQYYPIDSAIHRLDARIKLILTILYVLAIFFINTYFGFMMTAVVLLFTVACAKIPLGRFLRAARGIIFLISFTAIINLFMVSDGDVLWSFKALHITDTAVHSTIKIVLRLVLLVLGTSVLSLTTTPVDLADGVERLMSPLKAIKVPVRDIAMIMSIALRFIPTLSEETQRIMAAQKARGAAFDHGNLVGRIKALLPVLIPLMVNSLRRADDLADAMDSRCYNATDKRTKLKEAKMHLRDLIAFLLAAAFFTAILLDRYFFIGAMDVLIFGNLL
jgi:energy-coupling factor transport system permease protein